MEVEVALTEGKTEEEEEEGRVVRVHSSRRRGRDKSRRSSLLSEISKEVMVRVAEEGKVDSGFSVFPEMASNQKAHLLPRFPHISSSHRIHILPKFNTERIDKTRKLKMDIS